MRIKLIAAGAAIALAAAVGSASAAERFTTLEGIAADALTPQEMGVVMGAVAPATLKVDTSGMDGPAAQVPVTGTLTLSSGATSGVTEAFGAPNTEIIGAVTFETFI